MVDDILLRAPKPMLRELYRESLGSFIELYAIVEEMLRKTLQSVAGIDDETSLALFSGVRSDKAMNFIRRLYLARKLDIPSDLDRALQQFAVITNLRNDLLHHRVDFDHDPPITTNRYSVIAESAIRETEVNAYTLMHASEDLGLILLILAAFNQPELDGSADDLEWARLKAWKHKSGAPLRRDHPKSKARPKPRRPRGASQ